MKTYLVWVGVRGRKYSSGYDFATLEEANAFIAKKKLFEPTLKFKIEEVKA